MSPGRMRFWRLSTELVDSEDGKNGFGTEGLVQVGGRVWIRFAGIVEQSVVCLCSEKECRESNWSGDVWSFLVVKRIAAESSEK